MLLVVLLLVIEGIAQLYDYFFLTECAFTNSDAIKHLDIALRKQICNNYNDLQFHNKELHTQIVANQHFQSVNINSQGFRGPEFTAEKPDNTFRIFFLGGSTAFGSGASSDENTIPGSLQRKFETSELPLTVEVINAGIPGVTSLTETWLIKNKLVDLEPDLFIVYDGWNDVSKRSDNYGITHSRHLEIIKNNQSSPNEQDSEIPFYEIFQNFYREIKTRNIISKVLPNYLYSFGIYEVSSHDETPVPDKVKIWNERWIEICELGKQKGFDVVITVQPIAGSGNYVLTDFSKQQFDMKNNKKILKGLELYAEGLEKLEEHCLETMDLRNVFDKVSSPIYIDSVHLDDHGNEIVAESIFELTVPIVSNSIRNDG